MEVTKPERNSIAKAYGKVVSISVSFFIPSKNYILNLFKNLYMKKELINYYLLINSFFVEIMNCYCMG